jgi:hypothetical protein
MDVGMYLAIAVAGGLISGAIADSRGLNFGGYFVIGFLLPLIGIIVAAVAAPPGRLSRLTPAAGEGWWPDPMGRFEHRYFNGKTWTRFVGRDGQQFEDPV